jgi:hypothetical protein
MSKAYQFYERVGEDLRVNVQVEEEAQKASVSADYWAMAGVNYSKYHFADKSSISFGSNGFCGCETP